MTRSSCAWGRGRRAVPRGKRWSVPYLTRIYAAAGEFVMGLHNVGDDQRCLGRARRGRRDSLAERDRALGARGRELDNAQSSIGATSSSSLQPGRS
jgi:hypothetical protein